MTLEILGAGLGRTGTKSLKLALEQLGFGPCHHMHEISENPALLHDWVAAARGEKMNWSNVFKDFRSQLDWPGTRYWRELADHFPDAKVILTVRDPGKWHESIMKTIAVGFRTRNELSDLNRRAMLDMANEMVGNQIFGGKIEDRDHAISIFNNHISEVQAEISPDRLLTFNVTQGWEPLCTFLGVPVPNTEFPYTNTTTEFQNKKL